MCAFEIKVNSFEVCENKKESNLTRLSQPISKSVTDPTKAWLDSVSSQVPPDSASAHGLMAFNLVPISLEPTTSANLVHTININNLAMHFGDASILSLQDNIPPVLTPVDNMHCTAH